MRPLRAFWLVSIAVAAVSFSAGYVFFTPKGQPRADGAAPAGTLRGMLAGRFSAASEDRIAALFAAFEVRDPLGRDAAIFHAIKQFQPGDALGALGDLADLMRRVEKLPSALWPHNTEAVLERWLDVDAAGGKRWIESVVKLAGLDPKRFGYCDPASQVAATRVLARRDPAWALRHALALDEKGVSLQPSRSSALDAIFDEFAKRDAARARRMLAEISDPAA